MEYFVGVVQDLKSPYNNEKCEFLTEISENYCYHRHRMDEKRVQQPK